VFLKRLAHYRIALPFGVGSIATSEGNVLFNRILEVRRRPLNVLVFPGRRRTR
jgi:hypothetical protein